MTPPWMAVVVPAVIFASLYPPPSIRAQEPPTTAEADGSAGDSPTAASSLALDARLSPDGRWIAFRADGDGGPRLFARDALDTLASPSPLTPQGSPVGSYAWAPGSRHLVFMDEGSRRLSVVRLPASPAAAGRDEDGRVGGRPTAPDEGPSVPGQAFSSSELLADTGGPLRIAGFATEPPAVLVEIPGRWPDAPDLVRVDLETGARTMVTRNDGGVRRWIPDEAGVARLAVREDEDGGTEIVRPREGQLLPVYRCRADDVCEPVGFHPDGRVWLLSDRDRDTPALLLLDPLTAEEEVVRAELGDDVRAAFRDEAAFVEAVSRVRDVAGEDVSLTFHRPSDDRGRWLVEARSPGGDEILLFDRWSGTARPVLELTPSTSPTVTAPAPDPSVLAPVRLAYRVTEDGSGAPPVELVRRVERGSHEGSPVWRVVDEALVPTYAMPDVEVDALAEMDADALAEDPDAVDELLGDDPSFDPFDEPSAPTGRTEATDVVVLDGSTLAPIRRRAEGAVTIRLDFADGRVRGGMETGGFETSVDAATEGPVWPDGAGIEVLVAALPLMEGYRTRVAVLETETGALDTLDVTVTGSQRVTTPAGSFDAWRLRLGSSVHPAREETWLVRRGSPHHLIRAELRFDDLARITELTEGGGPS